MYRFLPIAILAPVLLAACGGGGSGGASPASASPPSDDPSSSLPLGFEIRDTTLVPFLADCQVLMREVIVITGSAPELTEPVNTSEIDPATGIESQAWYYWSQGFGVAFRWGGTLGGCEGTTFAFDPITS